MSNFKLTFKLKQHTPIIHFQHNQHGATLRASELKPKLDKFILIKIGKEKLGANKTSDVYYDEGIKIAKHKKWLIGNGDNPALDYKVRIDARGLQNVKMYEKRNDKNGKWETLFPTFFANMGKLSQEELVNFTSFSDIELNITSFVPTILDKIKDLFGEFLFITNFGTRQSKGFGSFCLAGLTLEETYRISEYLSINKSLIKSHEDIFNIINYYYQRLKSGINYSNHYKHSFLKLYLSDQNITWEKKWLKEKFIGLEKDHEEKYFGRAMLGLVGNYSFINPKVKREGEVYPDHKVDIEVKSEIIDRFKSPITFKPIEFKNEWRIYIIPEEVPEEMTSKEFEFQSEGKTHRIKTPKKVIDIKDLIIKYHEHLGNSFEASTFKGKKYTVKTN